MTDGIKTTKKTKLIMYMQLERRERERGGEESHCLPCPFSAASPNKSPHAPETAKVLRSIVPDYVYSQRQYSKLFLAGMRLY